MDHRRTRTRRTDDRFSLTLFKYFDEPFCYSPRFVAISSIECGLAATSLSFVKLNFTTNTPQHVDTTHPDAAPHLIDKTGNEERNLHNTTTPFT
jgi:hypothetical protein